MRKIIAILVFTTLSIFTSHAQYADGDHFTRKGTRLVCNGVVLDKADKADVLAHYTGTDLTEYWHRYSVGRNTGMWLTIGGSVTLVAGSGTFLLGALVSVIGATAGAAAGAIGGSEAAQSGAEAGAAAGSPWMTGGLIAAGTGLAAMGAGIPLLCVNNHKLNGLVGDLNEEAQSYGIKVAFGPTSGGLGLALTF